MSLKRITIHWTGGGNQASAYERTRYHFLCEGDGTVVEGDKPPEANLAPLGPDYVRHCGEFNSDNIGVGICGMMGAREKPFYAGLDQITAKGINAAVGVAADLCETYKIKVTRRTVFLHSEVRPRWGRGKYKWDVNFWPGMKKPGDPVEMGDRFRLMVKTELESRRQPVSLWVRFLQSIGRAA